MNASTVRGRSRLAARLAALVAVVALLSGVTTAATATFSADADVPGAASTSTTTLPVLDPEAASATRNSDGTIDITWRDPDIRPDIDPQYRLQRSIGGGDYITVHTGSAASFTDDPRINAHFTPQEVTDISAGFRHTCAVANGRAYCWGSNLHGQLGLGRTGSSNVPVAVDTSGVLAGLTVTDISAGFRHTCSVAENAAGDSRAYCWGEGPYGQLGSGSNYWSNAPIAVDVSDNAELAGQVTQVSAGHDHTCAVAGGNAYCWGNNNSGQLGNIAIGALWESSFTPVRVDLNPYYDGMVRDISAGFGHSCAVVNHWAYCWGLNDDGQLGNADAPHKTFYPVTPIALSTDHQVTAISAGDRHTCAAVDGGAYCWGFGGSGRLGDGSTYGTDIPVAVDFGGQIPSGQTIADVSAGAEHSCAITKGAFAGEGIAFCWGKGAGGRLGLQNPTTDVTTPRPVTIFHLNTVVPAISAGSTHGCAIVGYRAACWGAAEGYGQLGFNGDYSQSDIPQYVDTSGALGPVAYCDDDNWVVVAGTRCTPAPGVPVRYRIHYTKAGWSPTDATVVQTE